MLPEQSGLPGFERLSIVRCGVCNRPLTDPKSIEAGVGPVCGGKQAGKSRNLVKTLRQDHQSDYVEMLDLAAKEIERLQNLVEARR